MLTVPLALSMMIATSQGKIQSLPFHKWAETPPMGWNSWDCFGIGVTEQLTRDNAEYMDRHLKAHGYKLVTVDIDWFIPGVKGWNYFPGIEIAMDGNGRPLPAVDRFPSAAGGKGFKPLADWVHSKGMKFGVHILRGIPRKAVEQNLPILGTNVRAGDIADKTSLCPWNPDMYGVDMSKPGAQAWYDSMIGLLAEWGIDFVKVDDLSRPYHQPEIEAIRKAIDKTGRPIVFSTSPGATPLTSGAHVAEHANMWRVSDDFWDNWGALKEQFERLDHWTPFRGKGHWPDADMLPLGAVRQGQTNDWTNFTDDEAQTLMTLWSIARSPLILGGHLPKTDAKTLKLITNDEVLAVNRASSNGKQLWRKGDQVAWVATAPNGKDKYLALFNANDKSSIDYKRAAFDKAVSRSTPGHAVDIKIDVRGKKRIWLMAEDGGDGYFADHVIWANPKFDATPLTKWVSATQGYGETMLNKNAVGKPLGLNGVEISQGIGTHAPSTIVVDIPADATEFTVRAGLEREGANLNGGGTLRFLVFTQDPMVTQTSPTQAISVNLSDLGFANGAKVRDLWQHKDLGRFSDRFEAQIAWHGAGLYKISKP